MVSVESVGDLQLAGFSQWYRGRLRIMACSASFEDTSEADFAEVEVLLLPSSTTELTTPLSCQSNQASPPPLITRYRLFYSILLALE